MSCLHAPKGGPLPARPTSKQRNQEGIFLPVPLDTTSWYELEDSSCSWITPSTPSHPDTGWPQTCSCIGLWPTCCGLSTLI